MAFCDIANRPQRELRPIPGDVPHSAAAHTDVCLFELFSPVREEYKY
jgi:hypothetical protein